MTDSFQGQVQPSDNEHRLDRETVSGLANYLTADTDRAVALCAGDIHGAFMREVRNAVVEANGDPVVTTKYGLVRLQSQGLLASMEVDRLAYVCERVFAAAHAETDVFELSAEVRANYQEMITSAQSSPVALALMGIANDVCTSMAMRRHSSPEETPPDAPEVVFSNAVDAADVGGAVAGAITGAVAGGGAGGAIIGAVIGGIGGSAVAIFAEIFG